MVDMRILLSLLLSLTLLSTTVEAEVVKIGSPFLIINKAVNQLAIINNSTIQEIFPVGTGKSKELTPEGLFIVKVKAENPYYRKNNIPGGDPRNPLGTRWIGFDAMNTDGRIYGIHGTNQSYSVGKYVSNGCVRLRNSDVERLYQQVSLGTKILIVTSEDDFTTLAKKYGAIQ
jgi:lipoprotein-anchoring transpeptidase ErfK/SrfK